MAKKILLTGATDGIGLAAAEMLAAQGHHILLHGRNPAKLEQAKNLLAGLSAGGEVDSFVSDLSRLADVEALAAAVSAKHSTLDVLINNAGVYNATELITHDGLDVRFAVNTIAPYLLTQLLMPLLDNSARIINLSSAAQSPVDTAALAGRVSLADDHSAYAQSKLALTAWSRYMGLMLGEDGPAVIALNPGSMLGSKMVKQAFGVDGADISIGAKILTRAALSDEFANASGQYFDNDSGQFSSPHVDVLDAEISAQIVCTIEEVLADLS